MGVSNIEGDHPKGVPDKQQRGGPLLTTFSLSALTDILLVGYFKESGGAEHLGETGQAQVSNKMVHQEDTCIEGD